MSQRTDHTTLEDLRAEIEEIDREIADRIARRTDCGAAVARVKRARDLPTTLPEQERAVTERAGANAEAFDLDPTLVSGVARLLVEASKVRQREGSTA